MTENDFSQKAKQLIDDIKGICNSAGLGGDANEYKIVTQSFLYKFLNDKFLYEISKINSNLKTYKDLEALDDNKYQLLITKLGTRAAHFQPKHLLEYLFAQSNEDDFAQLFDNTLNDLSIQNSDIFSVHTTGNTEIRLFDQELILDSVNDRSQHDATARKLINKLADSKFDFTELFSSGFDFFSTLFEYMIKDYNKDGGGTYAEYYTPHSIAKIIANILIGKDAPSNVIIYDPAAGSGTLLMNLAHRIGTEKCSIYSEDISQKSTNLLRLNLILNNLSHSIDHIVQGNTIKSPRHTQLKFDYIVSNPPFKMDFSADHEDIINLPNVNERFFAGVPNIPPKSKNKMAIYQLFLQHIIYSLKPGGKAAVVVPTGFITAQQGIDKKIRQKLVDEKMLAGIVSMPSNIFATTGTNVSILFIDDNNKGDVALVDASNLGKKVSNGGNQKTVLSPEEEQRIIDVFLAKRAEDDFSVSVSYEEIAEKNYSLSAGQYFEVKIEYVDITPDEFKEKMQEFTDNLDALFEESHELELDIKEQLGSVYYEAN